MQWLSCQRPPALVTWLKYLARLLLRGWIQFSKAIVFKKEPNQFDVSCRIEEFEIVASISHLKGWVIHVSYVGFEV